MNAKTSDVVKKYGMTLLFLSSFVIALAAASFFTDRLYEQSLREAATPVVQASFGAQAKLGKPSKARGAGISFETSFEVSGPARARGTVFIVRVTGMSGPVTAVFHRATNGQAKFLGLVGMPRGLEDPGKNGVGPVVISAWEDRVSSIATKKDGAQ